MCVTNLSAYSDNCILAPCTETRKAYRCNSFYFLFLFEVTEKIKIFQCDKVNYILVHTQTHTYKYK